MSLPELIPSGLPVFTRKTPRSNFANSVVPQGSALLFAQSDSNGGVRFVTKNSDGTYKEVGSSTVEQPVPGYFVNTNGVITFHSLSSDSLSQSVSSIKIVDTGVDEPAYEGGGSPTDDPFALTDYIESSGTQWIDTGYVVTQNTSLFELVCTPTDNDSSQYPTAFGARNAYGYGSCQYMYKANSNDSEFYWSHETGSAKMINCGYASNIANKKVVIKAASGGIRFDTAIFYVLYVFTNPYAGTPNTDKTLFLFALHDGDDVNEGTIMKMKLYRFRIWEGNTLAHEFVPWTDSQNVACLKDTVTGNLKYNGGSGSFIHGTDVV